MDWLRESHADALDYVDKLIDENADLRRENARLMEEVERLLQENANLRREVRTPQVEPSLSYTLPSSLPSSIDLPPKKTPEPSKIKSPTETATQGPSLSLAERVNIFRHLFHGREDVYAKRWESQQKGTSGYSPACAMEWRRPHCTKPQKKCTECVYSPLTNEVLASHLSGHQTIGIYPMLPDDTCWFLAADFDGEGDNDWQSDAAAYLKTCREMSVPAYMERSRSGNGGHVWIFFEVPMLASAARKLGATILTKTMESRHEIKFATYDRFFPNQDTMPRGGFGNLIALPLQGRSVRQGNSVFLDETLQPYPDQWAMLQSVERAQPEHVEALVETADRDGAVVGVRLSMVDDEATDPWTQPPSKKRHDKKIPGVLPESLRVVHGNLLYIEKTGLASPFLNRLKRLAAFQNPEFYKTQAMRMPTYKTPRVIGCADEFDRHIGLPRGLLDELRGLLADHRIDLELVDSRFQGKTIDVHFNGELRGEQAAAAAELAKHDTGVLSATTAFGKTVVGAWMIAARRVNTLILVHRQELLDQWRERLSAFLGIDAKEIGQVGGGKVKPNGFLDVAMIQSLTRKGEVKDMVADYGHVIVDECHHVAAFTIESILKQVKARYILGLTATPTRKDGHHPIIVMQCGPIRHRVDARKQAAARPFDHIVLPRRTAVERPSIEMSYQEFCGALIADTARNQLIIADIKRALGEGRNPLVLTERKEHVDIIASSLAGSAAHLITMYGGRTKKERADCLERLHAVPPGESRILIATGKYIGEGFDDPRLDTLFLTLPISWKGTIQQYAGRLHRLYAGKVEVQVYDYVDVNVPMAWAMYEKRKKGYRAVGYDILPFE